MDLEKLEVILEEEIQRRREEEERRRVEEQRRAEEERAFWEKENALLPQKQELYNQIVSWVDELKRRSVFDKLMELKPTGVKIYHNGLGNSPNPADGWSAIVVKEKGLTYEWSIKFGKQEMLLTKQSVPKLTYDYLKDVVEHINSGEVYFTILKDLGLEQS